MSMLFACVLFLYCCGW